MTRGSTLWLAILLCGLWCMPAEVWAGDPRAQALQEEAMQLYKRKDFRGAIERLEQALKITPKNHELLRHIGSCHAMLGNRDQAYRHYRMYVERCPKCMYAPQLRENIRQYEEERGLAAKPRPATRKKKAKEEPARPPTREEDGQTRQAQALYEEAYVIKATSPERACQKLEEALRLVPEGHIYHSKARKLLERIRSGDY